MEQLVVVITDKRNIGISLIPFFVEMEGDNYLNMVEPASAEHFNTNRFSFTPTQKEIIKILDSINEQNLFKRFSKQKNLKLFFEKMDENLAENHIRPYVDKKITKALEIIALDETPLYYKNPKYSRIYTSDQINVNTLYDEALFTFNLDNTGLRYTLKIKKGDHYIGLTNREMLEITITPATFMINNQLFRFENIDLKKFKPFQRINHVLVKPQSVDTYMNTFVQTSIRNHEVEAIGFSIKDRKVDMRPVLVLEKDLSYNPILTLKFKYDQKEYLAGTQSEVFVDLHKNKHSYTFYRFRRDKVKEGKLIDMLKSFGLKNIGGSQYLPHTTNGESLHLLYTIVEWINLHYADLLQSNFIIQQDSFDESYYTGKVKLDVSYKEDNDWFDINALIQVGEFKIPFHKIRQHILKGKREYILPDKNVFVIPEEWFSRFADLMHFVEMKGDKMTLNKMHFNLLERDKLDEVSSDWKERIGELVNGNCSELAESPQGLNAQLRQYQQEGYTWMKLLQKNRFGGILADDMGLGKTIQTISLLLDTYNNGPKAENIVQQNEQLDLFNSDVIGFNNSQLPASLIVMPTSLLHNWANEIKKFAPQLKVYLYSGTNRVKTKEIGKILRHYHVVLSSYGVVRNDIEYLKNYGFHYLILDESQNIKNPTSKIYHAIAELQSEYKLVLTGTPIENALVDLWAQMNFVNHGLLGSLNFFKNNFAFPIERKNDEDKEQKLQQLITPFILRRTKDMVAKELPPVTEQILLCDMTEKQQKFYEREKSGIRNEILKAVEHSGVNKNAIMALKALTKLRQIANHPVLVDDKYKGDSGKYQQIFEKLENITREKHKVLIFSSFVKDLELIEEDLKTKRIKYSKLIGSTSDRQKAVNAFTQNDDCRVFLISLKAGGVGLNLVEADYVFVLNPWWNPAAESQAINRAHRIGQTKNVFVYKFISTDSIEEKIMSLQEKKLQLADTFITTNNPLKDISQSEFNELFA